MSQSVARSGATTPAVEAQPLDAAQEAVVQARINTALFKQGQFGGTVAGLVVLAVATSPWWGTAVARGVDNVLNPAPDTTKTTTQGLRGAADSFAGLQQASVVQARVVAGKAHVSPVARTASAPRKFAR